jgi:hypothetical protein
VSILLGWCGVPDADLLLRVTISGSFSFIWRDPNKDPFDGHGSVSVSGDDIPWHYVIQNNALDCRCNDALIEGGNKDKDSAAELGFRMYYNRYPDRGRWLIYVIFGFDAAAAESEGVYLTHEEFMRGGTLRLQGDYIREQCGDPSLLCEQFESIPYDLTLSWKH